MCGFCGVSFFSNEKLNKAKILGEKLNLKLAHRGPDDEGNCISQLGSNNLFFHRRLSILEISKKGSQPMLSNDNNLILCFNGEIYNHLELRKKLEEIYKISWKGNSDTETLIESFCYFGIEKTINLVEGMYAFALFDKKNEKLYLGRDLFGEKPLYYNNANNSIIFSSEVHNVDENLFSINQKAIYQFLHYNYIPNSNCIYNNWNKVNPGQVIVFDKNLNLMEFFNLKKNVLNEIKLNQKKFNHETEKEFDKTFTKVVKDILVADVDVGVFLSGGVDSSLVALYAKKIKKDLKTFSIGIKNNKDYDESVQSEKISKFLQTEHETFFIENEEIIENLENSVLSFDEPFADSSKILTYILSNKVKNKIKVALTGDGADELFGGYNRHIYAYYLEKISLLFGKNFINSKIFKQSLKTLFPVSKLFFKNIFAYPENKIDKLKSILDYKNEKDLIDKLISNKNQYDNLELDYIDDEKINKINYKTNNTIFKTIVECDTYNYLTDDILVKTDRASMKNSLETRAPFLNKNVFKFSQMLKDDQKIQNFKGKIFLRKILNRFFSPDLIASKKRGFSYPISEFFLNEQNQKWIKNIFFVKDNNNINLIENKKLENIFILHKNKQADYSNLLWSNLVLRLWLKKKGFIF